MSTSNSERKLYVSSQAATQLEQQRAQQEAERMAAKAKAEEVKQLARRAKQEQQLAIRSEKKALYNQAKEAERLVQHHAADYAAALELKTKAKKRIERAEEAVSMMVRAVTNAESEVKRSQKKLNDAVSRRDAAIRDLEEVKAPVDESILVLKKHRLKEAYEKANAAWDKVQKAIRKKERDRSLRRRVKGLLGL